MQGIIEAIIGNKATEWLTQHYGESAVAAILLVASLGLLAWKLLRREPSSVASVTGSGNPAATVGNISQEVHVHQTGPPTPIRSPTPAPYPARRAPNVIEQLPLTKYAEETPRGFTFSAHGSDLCAVSSYVNDPLEHGAPVRDVSYVNARIIYRTMTGQQIAIVESGVWVDDDGSGTFFSSGGTAQYLVLAVRLFRGTKWEPCLVVSKPPSPRARGVRPELVDEPRFLAEVIVSGNQGAFRQAYKYEISQDPQHGLLVSRAQSQSDTRVSVLTRLSAQGTELVTRVLHASDAEIINGLEKDEHDWRMDCINAVTAHVSPAKGFWLGSAVTGVPHITEAEADDDDSVAVGIVMPDKQSVIAWRIDETVQRLTLIIKDL
jgi:hypothetical protein